MFSHVVPNSLHSELAVNGPGSGESFLQYPSSEGRGRQSQV